MGSRLKLPLNGQEVKEKIWAMLTMHKRLLMCIMHVHAHLGKQVGVGVCFNSDLASESTAMIMSRRYFHFMEFLPNIWKSCPSKRF